MFSKTFWKDFSAPGPVVETKTLIEFFENLEQIKILAPFQEIFSMKGMWKKSFII
jgi:hypothetical protein